MVWASSPVESASANQSANSSHKYSRTAACVLYCKLKNFLIKKPIQTVNLTVKSVYSKIWIIRPPMGLKKLGFDSGVV